MSLPIMLLFTLIARGTASTAHDRPRPTIRMQAPPPPESVTGASASLPMSFTGGMPTLEVRINGAGPFKVGFDTGAPGGPHMTDRLVSALHLQPAGRISAGDPSGRNPVQLQLYRVERESFGGVEVRGWTGSAQPVPPGELKSLDAIVGLGAFAGYVVTLDYPRARFELRRGSLGAADGKHVFAYRDAPVPRAPLTVEGRTLPADIDTGNVREGVIVPTSFAEALKSRAAATSTGAAHTISGSFEMFSAPVSGAAVGATPLSVAKVGFPSLVPVANVGSLALRDLVLRIDPAHRLVSLDKR